MFRSRCKKVGRQLNYVKLQQSFPYFSGNIQIYIGDNVTVHSRTSFSAAKIIDKPILRISNQTYLGPGLSVSIAKEIYIGSYCHIASNVTISDNDGHPTDPERRAMHEPVDIDAVSPVRIEDNVWIGEGVCILKGISIGRCSIVAAKSVVTKNVEPYSIIAGNPAIVVKKVPFKSK
jgi:acetyltransferase-like isoleucine patch superfamily enzyme